jgi:hypothetical protein
MEAITKRYKINKLTIAIKKLLKTKDSVPRSYHKDIDKLIRKLTNEIAKI